MNIISQFVLGAAIGSLIGAKKLGNKAVLFGGLCSLVAFLDVPLSMLFETSTAVFINGGITHSIIFCLLAAPILGWIMHKFVGNACSVVFCSLIACGSMLAHCFADVFGMRGVGLFEPFTHRRFALSVLSDFDIVGMLPLVVAFIVSLILKENRHKAMISWFGMFLCVVYVAFAFLNKLSVQSQFEQKLDEQSLRYSRTEVFPVSGSLFMWNCIAQDRDGFWMCYQSNLSKNDFEMNLVIRNDYYLFEMENSPSINRMESYTKYYYSVEPKSDNVVIFNDLRFGRVGLNIGDSFKSSYTIDFSNKDEVVVSPLKRNK